MTENALKARYNGGTMPLGYAIDSEKHFVIDPLTAPIVQEIFTQYANGEAIKEIINSLNARGFKSSKGAKFNKSSLHTMLKNRKYIGEYKYKDIIIPDCIPAIISREVFDKVQKRLETHKHAPAKEKAKVNYLLSTKVFCGKCGAPMVGESGYGHKNQIYHYYKCANTKKHKSCDKKTVRKNVIEDLVIKYTIETVLKPETISYIVEVVYNMQSQENDLIPILKQNLKEVETSMNNMLNAIQQGIVTPLTKQRLEELEQKKSEIEVSILNEEMERPILTKEQIRFGIERFRDMDMNDEKDRQALIDTFVNSVYLYDDKMAVTYNYKDGTRTITFTEIEISDLVRYASPKNDLKPLVLGRFFFKNFITIKNIKKQAAPYRKPYVFSACSF